jgi:hypothetical protein
MSRLRLVVFFVSMLLASVTALFSNMQVDIVANKVITCISIMSALSIALVMTKINAVSNLDLVLKTKARKQIMLRLAFIFIVYFIVIIIWFAELWKYGILLFFIKSLLWFALYVSSLLLIDFFQEFS